MRATQTRVVVVGLLACLSGCKQTAPRPVGSDAAYARPLLSPALLGNRAANQVVHGAFGEREQTLNCVVSLKDGKMTVVGLTAMGVRAFTVTYDGTQVNVDNDLPVPSQLTPERLLADIQLVYWPAASLKTQLAKVGWELNEPYAHTRRLRRDNKLIAEIHYDGDDPWHGRSWLVNLEYQYTLGIDSSPLAQ